MSKTSPTQRSLKSLRENGWHAHIVERFLPARGEMKFPRRIDAFGFGDILAMREDIFFEDKIDGVRFLVGPHAIALVQCTSDSGGNMAAHRAKILAIPEFEIWKKAGGRVFLQGWAKKGPRGAKKHWTMREEEL
jgi:hypothetical protein